MRKYFKFEVQIKVVGGVCSLDDFLYVMFFGVIWVGVIVIIVIFEEVMVRGLSDMFIIFIFKRIEDELFKGY